MVFLKDFFEKVDFEKCQQTTKKHAKLPSIQRVKDSYLHFSVLPDQLVEEQELSKKNLEEINSLKSKLVFVFKC